MNIHNKYSRWYDNIVANAKAREAVEGYTEKHHIIPRCLGGSDCADNLVVLTAREHFLCHVLLTKCTTGTAKRKMIHALVIMKGFQGRERYLNSRLYDAVRAKYSKQRSEDMQGSKNHRYGVKMSEETKRKISKANKGRSNPRKGLAGKKWSKEQRDLIAELNSSGRLKWWHNGVENKRAKERPSPEWEPGRLFSKEDYENFCKSSNVLKYNK